MVRFSRAALSRTANALMHEQDRRFMRLLTWMPVATTQQAARLYKLWGYEGGYEGVRKRIFRAAQAGLLEKLNIRGLPSTHLATPPVSQALWSLSAAGHQAVATVQGWASPVAPHYPPPSTREGAAIAWQMAAVTELISLAFEAKLGMRVWQPTDRDWPYRSRLPLAMAKVGQGEWPLAIDYGTGVDKKRREDYKAALQSGGVKGLLVVG